MIAAQQAKSSLGFGLGAGLVLAGYGLSLALHSQSAVLLEVALTAIGSGFFLWGCYNFAQAKGYSPHLGLIVLLGGVGLIVLLLLPDKHLDGGPPRRFLGDDL